MANIENTIKGSLVIGLILLGVTFPEWGHFVKPMLTLFDDAVVIGILGLVLVLVTWYDCKLGLAFFVLVAFVLFNRQDISGVVEGFLASMESNTTGTTTTAMSSSELTKQDLETAQAQERSAMAAKAAVENAAKAQANNAKAAEEAKAQEQREADKSAAEERKAELQARNQKVLSQPTTTKAVGLKSSMPELASGAKEEKGRRAGRRSRFADIEGFTSGSPCEANKDFNTYVGRPEYPGYDVAGGRFDFVNSTQNMTIHGPPLSWCPTYTASAAKLATPFYPLNA